MNQMMMNVHHVIKEDTYKMDIVVPLVVELHSQMQKPENVKVVNHHVALVMDQVQATVTVVHQENISGIINVFKHALMDHTDLGYGENVMLAILSVKLVQEIQMVVV